MSGFANTIANNLGQLIRRLLQSDNYVAGTSGWMIAKDGTAEFNSATFRGTIQVGGNSPNPRIVIGSTAVVPAALAAWAAANAVTIGSIILMYWDASNYKWEATGTFAGIPCTFSGTYDTFNGVYVLTRTIVFGGSLLHRIGSYSLNPFALEMYTSNTYFHVGDGNTYTGDRFESFPGAWTPLGLLNGWGNFGGGYVTTNYRVLGSPANSVQLVGIISGGTSAAGTVIANVPVGFRPASRQRIPIYAFGAAMNLTTEVPAMDILTNGDIVLNGAVNAGVLSISGIWSVDV